MVTAALARGKPGDPKPIPGGFSLPAFVPVPSDPFIHVLPPLLPFEMSTIGDLDGTIGAADIQGTAHGSDGTTYTFDADMRFMQGVYVDTAGHVQHGSFAFIWIDLFTGAVGDLTTQVHDFNPGIAPSGLFWTIPIEPGAIKVNPATGEARLRVQALKIPDYHDLLNSLGLVPGPPPVPSRVSFEVRWAGHGAPVDLHDTTFGFMGHYVTGPATISFTASNNSSSVVYRSDATGQSNPGPPGVGTEQNGVFFH
jgi:hypothetical protein